MCPQMTASDGSTPKSEHGPRRDSLKHVAGPPSVGQIAARRRSTVRERLEERAGK